jgi:hypothetical protein
MDEAKNMLANYLYESNLLYGEDSVTSIQVYDMRG